MIERRTKIEILFLIFISCFYLFFSIRDIELPGLFYDNCWNPLFTIRMLKGKTCALDSTRQPEFQFREKFPIVTAGTGSHKVSYLLLPLFYLFGANIFVFRLVGILFAIGGIILTFYLTKSLFDRKIAFLTVSLLALDPTLFIITRLFWDYGTILFFFGTLSLFTILKWHTTKKNIYFYLGCFFLGFGADIQLVFWGFIFALIFAFLILRPNVEFKSRQIIWGCICFLAGIPLYLYYNIMSMSKGGTLGILISGHRGILSSEYINILTKYKDMFFTRWYIFKEHLLQFNPLRREGTYRWIALFRQHLFLFILLAMFLYLSYLILFHRKDKRNLIKRISLLFIFLFVIYFLSLFYFLSYTCIHQINFIPFLQIIIALFFIKIPRLFKGRISKSISIILLSLILMVIFTLQLHDLNQVIYDWQAASTMSHGYVSNAVYKLTEYLLINKINKPYVIGWGITNQIQFISQDKIEPIQIRFSDTHKQETIVIEEYKDILKNPNCKYILFSDKNIAAEEVYFDLFQKAARDLSLNLRLKKTIFAPDGITPFYLVYSFDK